MKKVILIILLLSVINIASADDQMLVNSMSDDNSRNTLYFPGTYYADGLLLHGIGKTIVFENVIIPEGAKGIVLGDAAHPLYNSEIRFNKIVGHGENEGILAQNSIRNHITGGLISNVKYGINISSVGFVNDNTFRIDEITGTQEGIYYNPSSYDAEGNRFYTSVFGSNVGINITHIGSGSNKYTKFDGVIDNIAVHNSYDIIDSGGFNQFNMLFVRDLYDPAINKISMTSTYMDLANRRLLYERVMIGASDSSNSILELTNSDRSAGWLMYRNNQGAGDLTFARSGANGAWDRTDFYIEYASGGIVFPYLSGSGTCSLAVNSYGKLVRDTSRCW